MYDAKVITKEKIKVIKQTNMLELLEEEYLKFPEDNEFKAEYDELLKTLEVKKDELFDKIDNPSESVAKVIAFFENENLIQTLSSTQSLTIENISLNHNITIEMLDEYYKYSKFKYDCGLYEVEKMLLNYLSVSQSYNPNILGALWGRLACLILMAKWDLALIAFNSVKEAIENRNISSVEQLRLRAWLLHWALFIFINQDNGIESLIDLYNEKYYLQTIENLCPWLIRYYAVAIILSPIRRRTHLREILIEINNISYQYSDPITLFLQSLFQNFDFDEAQLKLIECYELIKTDFFLQIYVSKFIIESRILICEMYCTINHRIDLNMLSTKLQLTLDETERWMVDMIRIESNTNTTSTNNSHTNTITHSNNSNNNNQISNHNNTLLFDAKINSAAKQIIMTPPTKSGFQSIAEKTRELTTRSETLNNNLQKILPDQLNFINHKKIQT